MDRLLLSFVVGIAIAAAILCGGSTAMLKHSHRVYIAIEEHLNKHVRNTDDSNSVMAEAKDWLASLRKSGSSSKSKALIGTFTEDYEELIDALEKFTALGSAVADKRCDQDSYVIRFITGQVNGREMNASVVTYRDTIKKFAREHALSCRIVFSERYQAKLSSLNEILIHRLEVALNDIVFVKALQYPASGSIVGPKRQKWTLGHLSKIDMLNMLKNEMEREKLFIEMIVRAANPFDYTEHVDILYQAIEALAKEDEDQEFVNQTMKKVGERYAIGDIKRVLERYVLDPCSYFYSQLGPNIFSPAYQDVMSLESRRAAILTDEKLSDYYFSWAKYRVCEELLLPRRLRQYNLNNAIKSLSLKAMNPYFG